MPSILVVDDAAVDRRLAGGLLERAPDLSVRYAESGAQALQSLDVDTPDLVLTDLQMPDIDGLQLLNRIQQRYPEMPVVLMTAHGSENVAAQALANGAASYVPKSELAENLLGTVLQILSLSHTDQRYKRLITCATKTEFEFELDNDTDLIEPLVDLVQQVATSMGACDTAERVRMGVALENALLNAMLRGNLEIPRGSTSIPDRREVEARRKAMPYARRRVHVQALITRDEARFVIRDDGRGFDTTQVPRGADPKALCDGGGRGFMLITTFMDEVAFNQAGNEITMVKRHR